MTPTHCPLYCHTDPTYRDTKETNGNCLDYTDSTGRWQKCMDAIAQGKCSKNRKTPVLP